MPLLCAAPTWIGVGVGIGIGIEAQHELRARATGDTVREEPTEYAVVGIDPDADSDSDPETDRAEHAAAADAGRAGERITGARGERPAC